MKPQTDRQRHRLGLGLLEVVVVLAVVAILAVTLAAAMPRMLIHSRVATTKADMQQIHNAIFGDPEQGYYGFVGDLGRAPRDVDELISRSRLPRYDTDTAYEIPMGWNGPYLQHTTSNDPTRDAFGTAYKMDPDEPGRVLSAGPDGLFNTKDDLAWPQEGSTVAGDVRVELSHEGDFIVRLFYSDSGNERVLEARRAPYIFEDVHYGPHAVEVWKVNDKKDDVDLVRRTVIICNGHGGIFRIDLHTFRGGARR